jgi:fatty acid desaturase
MPEDDKSSILETIMRAIARRVLGGLSRYAEQVFKRLLRLAGLYAAGIVIALLGIGFLAAGTAQWLATIVPGWLAWMIVGIILFLWGVVLTLTAFLATRS